MTKAANLAAQASNINDSGVAGIPAGGTGAATLTANNVLLGNGTSALQAVAPGTSGNVLTSNGTTWSSSAPPSSTPTTAQVLTATAGATAGAVGTYAFLATINNATQTTFGNTIAGASLTPVGVANAPDSTSAVRLASSGSVSGTWRVMGNKGARVADSSSAREATLFLRIS
jgi:hypothetical protein